MPRLDLSGPWSFAYVATSEGLHIVSSADLAEAGLPLYPCVVPGNFELDLCANGIFNGDPLFGKNIVELRKYETYHVWYVRRFDIRDVGSDRAVLVFEGIDCIADIYLNGTWVGATDNMLIEHEFDITDSLQPENEIVVHIHPAGERAAEYAYPPAVVTMPHLVDSTYIRKAPHSYGWDIMPRALSAGLWRPVSLDIRPGERIDWLYLANTEIEKDLSSATLMLRYTLDLPLNLYEDYEIQVSGRCGDSVFSARSRLLYKSGLLEIRVSEPALWWPRGRGAANLYDVTVQLMKRGTDIDTRSFRHGIRTVRLDRTDITDSEGHGEFCFYVNHERVFAKGTNWVPVDVYHSRDAERIPRILEQVEDIGCNMIRCWGGNVYENDLFYDLCDEKGILVWQDFIMACSVYPQDDAFRRRLAEEARSAIRRLRQHACLTLWAGDNECDDAWLGSPMHLDPNDNALTRTVLPDVLREEDPFRPYLPSSPYISRQNVILGQSSMPEAHLWGSRHDHRSDYFKQANCHFVSEVGVLSCPPVSSIRKFIPEESLWPFRDNAFWTLHATSPIPGVDLFDYRVHLLAQQVTTLFGRLPDNLEDFVFATQVSQAEAMKSIIERFRSQMWRRTGVLWWNIMDGWPQFSDAVVDYYFERKLAYEFIKRAQEPLCLVIREEEDRSLVLVAVNDTREECRVQYCVSDVQSNEVIAAGEAIASADSAVVLSCLPCPGSESGMYRIRWTYAGTTGMNHFLYGRTTHDLGTYRRLLSESYSTADAVSVEAPSWD